MSSPHNVMGAAHNIHHSTISVITVPSLSGLGKAARPTRHPPVVAPGLAGLPAGPLPPPPDALRLPLASAACMRAATFSCVACSGRPQCKDKFSCHSNYKPVLQLGLYTAGAGRWPYPP